MYFPHALTAEIVQHDVGSERYRYTVIFVPDDVKAALPLADHPKLRITGEVDDHPIEAALTPVRGAHYILLSKKLLAAIGKHVGDTVELRFRIADQEAVDVPERLADALERDAGMRALWEACTPGKQRALAYMVASARRAATQDERIAKVAAVLRGAIDLNGRPLT
jgi:hypothetical protein